MRTVLQVEIWSDVVCPWCYIGKQRFERAVAQVSDDIDVQYVYRPYQLDPRAPTGAPQPVAQAYEKKFGSAQRAAQIIEHVSTIAAAEGIEFRMDRALRANTLLAHRLLWLAESTGHQHQLKERLLQAYFQDGLDVGDAHVLADCAADVGMDHDTVMQFLAGDEGTHQVAELIAEAAHNDITAVPTYVIGAPGLDPSWMVPGAQDTDVFVQVLRRSAQRVHDAHEAQG
jgi:predicted DsbA family dithiol-disulfide isomerase